MSGTKVLTPQQVQFYRTFGFLRLPGVFSEEAAEIEQAFESVFADEANERFDIDVELHGHQPRVLIPRFLDRHPYLAGLRQDPRVTGVVEDLLGPGAEYAESDGNLYWCDSDWHCDVFGSPLEIRHLKLGFYLDRLDASNGAVRVIPGTNHHASPYATELRQNFLRIGATPSTYGVDGAAIPSVVLESEPGDLLMWDFRTLHAVYNGMPRRRLFTVNFREATITADVSP